ncbi:MAG: glycosyltransferase family 1 protein [Sphingobacteriales bacterium]|nr:MAG: glycosyltransferase family 1 protein [Sphingobacteriales bacterium]
MNILFVCDEYPPGPHGGIGTAVQTLARQLVKTGHRVWVAGIYDYGYGGRDVETDEGVQVYRLRKRSEMLGITMRYTLYDKVVRKLLTLSGLLNQETQEGLDRLLKLIERIHQTDPLDLIEITDHQHYTRQISKPVQMRLPAIPTVLRLHGGKVYFDREAGQTPDSIAYTIEKKLLEQSTVISSVSRYTGLKTLLALDSERQATVIPNGVAMPDWSGTNRRQPKQVMFTGSLLAKKGIFELMKAWNRVSEQQPEAQLMVYGKGAISELQQLLTAQAQETVFFKGHVSREEVLAAWKEASIAALPSYAEAFAIAPLEAMANGVATVYSVRTSGTELIENGVDGLLIEPSDTIALADALVLLLENPELRQQMARKGQEKIARQYTIEAVTSQQEAFYQTVINNYTGGPL